MAKVVPRSQTPGGKERGTLGMDGASDILKALLGSLLVTQKDLIDMDWSGLTVPGSDTDDEPTEYTIDDFDWDVQERSSTISSA